MAERDSTQPPFGLRCLARIVDNERIDHRHGAQHHFRRASLGQSNAFARQPFQCAMRAAMNHHVHISAQPDVKGNIGVAGRQIGVVIVGFMVRFAAPIRLDGDGQLAAVHIRKGKIRGGRAPCGQHRGAEGGGQMRERSRVIGEAQDHARRGLAQAFDQRGRVNFTAFIACGVQMPGDAFH